MLRRADAAEGRPVDCVVVAGASLTGLLVVAELSPARWHGRVILVDPGIERSRRLVGGCSLRRSTLEAIAAALACTPDDLVSAISGGRATVQRLNAGVASCAGERIRFSRDLTMHELEPDTGPLGLSASPERIRSAVRQRVVALGVQIVPRSIDSARDLAALAPGARALLINASSDDLFARRATPPPRHWVVASQAPCVVPAPRGLRLSPFTAHVFFAGFPEGMHATVFCPFHDPRSPAASWYGIDMRLIAAREAADPERAIGSTSDALARMAAAVGLELHDPAETLGTALAPVPRRRRPASVDGTFDAVPAFSPGAAAIYGDGMLAAATGAQALGAAIRSGSHEHDRMVARALRGIRVRNRLMQTVMWTPFDLVACAVRLVPRAGARWVGAAFLG
jgi:hypothetical protein